MSGYELGWLERKGELEAEVARLEELTRALERLPAAKQELANARLALSPDRVLQFSATQIKLCAPTRSRSSAHFVWPSEVKCGWGWRRPTRGRGGSGRRN